MPSDQFVSFITHCEDIFSSRFMGMLHVSKVCDRLVNAILSSVDLSWFTATDCSTNLPSIVRSYIKLTAHAQLG